jgi:hypothetical protein
MANTNRSLETRSPGDRFVLAAHPQCASRLAPAVLVFSERGPVVRQCGGQGRVTDLPTRGCSLRGYAAKICFAKLTIF